MWTLTTAFLTGNILIGISTQLICELTIKSHTAISSSMISNTQSHSHTVSITYTKKNLSVITPLSFLLLLPQHILLRSSYLSRQANLSNNVLNLNFLISTQQLLDIGPTTNCIYRHQDVCMESVPTLMWPHLSSIKPLLLVA